MRHTKNLVCLWVLAPVRFHTFAYGLKFAVSPMDSSSHFSGHCER